MARPLVFCAWQPEEPGEAIVVERILKPACRVQWLHEFTPDLRRDQLPQVDAIIVRGWPTWLTPELPRMRRLRLVQSVRAGVEHLPFDAFLAMPKPPKVASGSGWNAAAVAEHAWALTLACAKRTSLFDRLLREGRPPGTDALVDELEGRTLGVLGYGSIGRRVARVGAALGMRVMATKRHPPFRPPVVGGADDLERVLRASDVVVVTLPLTNETQGLLDEKRLGWMKPEAVLVNVARAEIVDRDALRRRLEGFPAFRAGLDVWWPREDDPDPMEPPSEFRGLPNVVMTPHAAALIQGWLPRALAFAAENVARFAAGGRVRNVVRSQAYAEVNREREVARRALPKSRPGARRTRPRASRPGAPAAVPPGLGLGPRP